MVFRLGSLVNDLFLYTLLIQYQKLFSYKLVMLVIFHTVGGGHTHIS